MVKGLTTAASLWAVAAIGLAVGGGLYVAAIAATVLVVGILAGVKPIEERWRDRLHIRALHLTVKTGSLSIDTLQEVTGERASRVRQFVVRPGDDEGVEEVTIAFVRLSQTSVAAIAERLRQNPSVLSVRLGSEV